MVRVELSRDGLEGRYLYDDDWPYLLQYPLDQLLVIHALGVAGGALMHAASIAGRDGAFLVAGPSGAGKTTMSLAAAPLGALVLSDERSVVRPAPGGGWLVGGTPWPGDGGFAEERSVPLRALILLEQSDRDELTADLARAGAGLLYRCHFLPLWDPIARERTVEQPRAPGARAARVPLSQPKRTGGRRAAARAPRRRRLMARPALRPLHRGRAPARRPYRRAAPRRRQHAAAVRAR